MDFLKAYSTLLPTIYDSAITADFWGSALDQCATLVDSKSATLLIVEMNDADPYNVSAVSSVFISDENETLLTDYVRRYAHHEQAVCDFLMQRNAQQSTPRLNTITP